MRNFDSHNVYTFDIPLEDSIAVLEFIGLVPDSARRVYQRYIARPDPEQCPDDLMVYVRSRICLLSTSEYEAVTCCNALIRIGVHQEMQDAILDPIYREIFATQSLHYRVRETLQTNHAAPIIRQGFLKDLARRTMMWKKEQKRSSPQGLFGHQHQPSGPPPTQRSEVRATIKMEPEDVDLPAEHAAFHVRNPSWPDRVVLYKGKALKEQTWDQPLISQDGSIDMQSLLTFVGEDFNSRAAGSYWNLEPETLVLSNFLRYLTFEGKNVVIKYLVNHSTHPLLGTTSCTNCIGTFGKRWSSQGSECKNADSMDNPFHFLMMKPQSLKWL